MTRFVILCDDFECEELRSVYCHGAHYTLRDGNALLANHLKQWLAEGKAQIVDGALAQIKGS